jgi:hypothetical protein
MKRDYTKTKVKIQVVVWVLAVFVFSYTESGHVSPVITTVRPLDEGSTFYDVAFYNTYEKPR